MITQMMRSMEHHRCHRQRVLAALLLACMAVHGSSSQQSSPPDAKKTPSPERGTQEADDAPTILWSPFINSLNSTLANQPEIRFLSSPGQPCQISDPLFNNPNASTLAKAPPLYSAVCPAGFRCSRLTYESFKKQLNVGDLPSYVGVCAPCIYGEWCWVGTVEKNPTQLADCGGVATFTTSSAFQMQKQSALMSVQACMAFSPCPEGYYCPDPTTLVPCPTGSYCPAGSVSPETCNFPTLLQDRPFKPIQPSTELVMNMLIKSFKPVGANTCPDYSGSPFMQCPAGFYCPNQADVFDCPKGYFCPQSTVDPRKCPFMADCGQKNTKTLKAKWWWLLALVAVIFLMPLTLQCWTIVSAYRIKRRRSKHEHLRQFMQMVDPASILLGGDMILNPESHYGLADDLTRMKAYSGSSGAMAKATAAALGPRVSVRFEGITVRIPKSGIILQGVSGYFVHSRMHAVMGPSGCGKSTLITSLAGTLAKGKLTGRVEYTRHHGNKSYSDQQSRVRWAVL